MKEKDRYMLKGFVIGIIYTNILVILVAVIEDSAWPGPLGICSLIIAGYLLLKKQKDEVEQ